MVECNRQDNVTGLSFLEPARLQLNTRSESLSFGGVHPGVILADAQETSSVGGFRFMQKRKNWLSKEEYRKKLLDPRWQKRRLEILQRDDWTCQLCFSKDRTLHVHHRFYADTNPDPWEYPDYLLVTLCAVCHECETEETPVYSKQLVDAFKGAGFFSTEFAVVADAVQCLAGCWPCNPGTIASALCDLFSDIEKLQQFAEEHKRDLDARSKTKG